MNSHFKILFVEDLPNDAELAVIELKKGGLRFEHTRVDTQSEFIKNLDYFKPDIVISDYHMPTYNGLQALKDTREFDPLLPFILFTGSVNEEIAVKCMKAGATDYVIKGHITRLPFAVTEALEQYKILTEKRTADLLLKESEEKIQSIFRAAPIGIGLVADRILLEVNGTFCKMTGYSRKELIGKHAEMLYPSKEISDYVGREKYRQILEKGTGFVETLFKCKDGSIINVKMSSTPLDKNDLSKGVTFTVLDITERIKAEKALHLSEEIFRHFMENSPVYVFFKDARIRSLRLSRNFEKMIGRPMRELLGKSMDELFPSDLAKKMVADDLRILDEGKLIEIEEELNGRIYNTIKFPISIDGKPVYLAGFTIDITDQKHDSEALKTSLSLLNASLESTADGILIADGKGNIIKWNQKFAEMWGLPEKLLDRHDDNAAISYILNKLADPDKFLSIVSDLYANPDKSSFDEIEFKDGRIFERYSQPQKIENTVIGRVWSFRDVTQRRLLEASTKASEQRYRELFLNNPVPTYIFDENTLEFIEVNDAAVQRYGYSREEFLKMTLKDIRLPEDVPTLLEFIRSLDKDSFSDIMLHHRKKDGSVFPVEVTTHTLSAKNGQNARLAMATDITERVKAAEQMQLGKEKAEASDNLKTSFLNNISHEVRTPLNGILGFAEIMSSPRLSDEDKRDSLSMLHESSDRLLNTITNYMDISLITSGNMSVNKKDFIPGQVLRKKFDNYKKICSDRKLELLLSIPVLSENLTINTDPEIFQKIINHLLNNAIKFTEKGSVRYGYIIHEGEIEFFVKDTGIGIGKESIEIVFDHFVKEDHGPLVLSEGSGLGLSISKGMAEMLGGKIRVESEKGKGSSFFFTLPILKENKADYSLEQVVKKTNSRKTNVILVAEDDDINFYCLQTILKQNTSAEIIHAFNGKEAVERFTQNPDIGLVLMDIKMPVMNGLEATRLIKAINRNIPVIAITAYAMAGDADRILDAGCDYFLPKPIDKDQLLGIIAEFIIL
jgi:PAS domain S-box-containing protein